ncbi:MAG: hypothetical protein AAGE52_18195 [Myxococcota bacterium]
MKKACVVWSALIALSSCGEEGTSVDPAAATKADPIPRFDVHEWGLLDVALDGTLRELSAGPGQAGRVADLGIRGYGKPVLYFHTGEKTDGVDVQVEVSLGEGLSLAERFPDGEVEERSVRWNVRVASEPCAAERTYPDAASERCQQVADRYCETAELGDYETSDAACLRSGDTEVPLLFYRGGDGEGEPATMPLEVQRNPDGSIQVTNRGTAEPIGQLWRVVRYGRRAVAVDWPAPGETVTIPAPTQEIDDAAHEMFARDLEAHGLTEQEQAAFDRAWHEVVWGPRPAPVDEDGSLGLRGTGRGGGGVGGPPIGLGNPGTIGRGGLGYGRGYGRFVHGAKRDALLYWLPADAFDEIATLSFEPEAATVRRATLVRVDLSGR